jgi:hypothetical protein
VEYSCRVGRSLLSVVRGKCHSHPRNVPSDDHAGVMVASEGTRASRGKMYSRFALECPLPHKGKRGLPLYSPDPQSDRTIRDVENADAEGGGSARPMRTP